MSRRSWEVLLTILTIFIFFALGMVAREVIEYNAVHYACQGYQFDGGGRDYSVNEKEANTHGYRTTCFREAGDSYEVVPLDWVRLNCTKRGECLGVKQ